MNTRVRASLRHTPLFSAALSSLVAAFLASSQQANAATVNVTSYGATGNGTTDDTTAIQNAINASASGDTVYFPTGTYKLTNTLTLLSSRTYSGQTGSILSQATTNKFCAGPNSPDTGVTLTGLTFQYGGIVINTSSTPTNFTIKNCTFQNITNSTYPYNEAIYMPTGGTGCNFVGNTFKNIMGDTGLIAWNLSSCTFTDNYFDTVNEGVHLNGPIANCTVARNTGVNMHRMGIETQGAGYTNFLVEDNHFSHWATPFYNSFGLSIVPIGSGMSETTQYNTLLGRPAAGSGARYGYALEVGQSNLVQNNFIEGYFCNGIVFGGPNSTAQNNVLRGPVNSGLSQDAISIGYEPGGDPNTTTIAGNTQTNTSSFLENPTNLAASVIFGDQVSLTWVNNDTHQTGIEVQRHVPGGVYSVVATGLSGTTTTYTDTTASPNTTYAYRIRAYDGSGNLTYSPAVLAVTGTPTVIKFEVENLTVAAQTAGVTYRLSADVRFSGGNGSFFDSTATGQFVTFDVPGVSAGTYDVRIGIKKWNNKGTFQTAISRMDQQGSPTNVGSVVDEYASGEVFTEVDLGVWTPAATGDKAFKFTVTGKNASSSSYGLSFDYIALISR